MGAPSSKKYRRAFSVSLVTSVLIISSFSLIFWFSLAPTAEAQEGHDLPPSAIGDRKPSLDFQATPQMPSPGDKVTLAYSFMDQGTGNPIQHTTYLLTINGVDGRKVFSEVMHGHDGKINLQFRPNSNSERYKVNANYDNLAASYVADYGGSIIVDGPVFSTAGIYKIAIEVTGIDYDNTFLDSPIVYNYSLPVLNANRFPINYQNMTFNVNIMSPATVSNIELEQENKQVVINFPADQWRHFDNFTLQIEFPKEMMSGPFTASLHTAAGMVADLNVQEQSKDEKNATLILTGQHLDMAQMQMGDNSTSGQMDNMEGMNQEANDGSQGGTNSVVISATNVIPEFQIGMIPFAAAIGITVVLLAVTRINAVSVHLRGFHI